MTSNHAPVSADVDALVVGAGLAGLHFAARVAAAGYKTLVIDRRRSLAASIRTTGIFVAKTLSDYALPDHALGPAIRDVALYPPDLSRPVQLTSARDEFRVGNMAAIYEDAAARARAAGAEVRLGTRFAGPAPDGYQLLGPGGPRRVRARILVGADGTRSGVARTLGLPANRHILAGAELVYRAAGPVGPPTFHCVLDPHLAPGYLAWVVDDGEHIHVGLAGYPGRFPASVSACVTQFAAAAPGLTPGRVVGEPERRAGLIPVGGILPRIATRDGLLIGDAAGAVSPLTAGGLDPCLRLSDIAADTALCSLDRADPSMLLGYDGAEFRRRFRGRLALRAGLGAMRSRGAVTAAFAGMRTPPGRAAASRILFGDRSFPDAAPQNSAMSTNRA